MDGVSTVLFQYGVAGVALFVQGLVIIRQYNDYRALQAKYDQQQESRRMEIKELADKAVLTMSNQADVSRLMYDKLKSSKEA